MGLPEGSRIAKKQSGINLTIDQMLLAMLIDSLNGLRYQISGKKSSRPFSILDRLMNPPKKDDLMKFETPEDYLAYMKRKKRNG